MVSGKTKHKSRNFRKKLSAFARRNHETFWLATTFLPAEERLRALCMLCLDGEFYRIVDTVQEPMVAQIRLQWWRDEIEKMQNGADSQATLPAEALDLLLSQSAENRKWVERLIDAYDDGLSGAGQRHAQTLFAVMLAGTGKHDDQIRSVAERAGQVFRSSNAGSLAKDDVLAFACMLSETPDGFWPWLSLFTFLPDWHHSRKPSSLTRRWRLFSAFLGGERKLATRLRSFADTL